MSDKLFSLSVPECQTCSGQREPQGDCVGHRATNLKFIGHKKDIVARPCTMGVIFGRNPITT